MLQAPTCCEMLFSVPDIFRFIEDFPPAAGDICWAAVAKTNVPQGKTKSCPMCLVAQWWSAQGSWASTSYWPSWWVQGHLCYLVGRGGWSPATADLIFGGKGRSNQGSRSSCPPSTSNVNTHVILCKQTSGREVLVAPAPWNTTWNMHAPLCT